MALGPMKHAEARDDIADEYPLAKIVAAVTLLQAGKITEEFFVSLVVDLLRAARVAVAVKVDALIAVLHELQPIGFVPRDFASRDRASLETVMGNATDARLSARLQSFAASTLEQATRDFHLEIGRGQGATHWRWRTAGPTCDECSPRRGKVFIIDEPFSDHPNCNCYAELIFKEGSKDERN